MLRVFLHHIIEVNRWSYSCTHTMFMQSFRLPNRFFHAHLRPISNTLSTLSGVSPMDSFARSTWTPVAMHHFSEPSRPSSNGLLAQSKGAQRSRSRKTGVGCSSPIRPEMVNHVKSVTLIEANGWRTITFHRIIMVNKQDHGTRPRITEQLSC